MSATTEQHPTQRPTFATSADAVRQFESQGEIPPGTPGFWRVWGAQPRHIETGDLVLSVNAETGDQEWDLIVDTFTAKAAPLRIGVETPEGRITIGALTPVIVLRWGTHHDLAR